MKTERMKNNLNTKKVEREFGVRVWVSKYALTQGIYSVDDCEITPEGYASKIEKGSGSIFIKMGKDAARTEEGAKAQALRMAKRRLTSLQEQVKKVEEVIRTGFTVFP